MRLESSFSGNIRKSASVAIFAKHFIVDLWQYSEYALGCKLYQGSEYTFNSKYVKVWNMFLVLNVLGFRICLSRNIRKFHFQKYKKVPFPETGFFEDFHFQKIKDFFEKI